MQKTFITCAVTGAGDGFKRNPHVPVTPDDIAASALAAAKVGAAIVHIHVRDPATSEGSRDDKLYERVFDQIRDENTDVIINFTAGMGGDAIFNSGEPRRMLPESDLVSQFTRLTHVEKLRPDICTLDCGSYNVGEGDIVYISTTDDIRSGAKRIRELGVRPELEIFDLGHLRYVLKLMDESVFAQPTMMQFCLGVPFGAPAEPLALKAMYDMIVGKDIVWSAFGVGRDQMRIVAQSVLLGGHVRVGLEDNLYLRKGQPARNEELVERAAHIIDLLGSSVMSALETRELLSMSDEQTLVVSKGND